MSEFLSGYTAGYISKQAAEEVDEIMGYMFEAGLPKNALITLSDVRRAMLRCWERGYGACLETRDQP